MNIFPPDFTKALTIHTAENANFDKTRNYISMSHSNLRPIEMMHQYNSGFHDDLTTRLKCYKGYQMERDLVQRIVNIYGKRITLKHEIIAHGGLVKGHPDFLFDGYPCDCKSVLEDKWIPKNLVPFKVLWQMQSYMFYMGLDVSMVVYESRESGIMQNFIISADKRIQKQIETNHLVCVEMIREPSRQKTI